MKGRDGRETDCSLERKCLSLSSTVEGPRPGGTNSIIELNNTAQKNKSSSNQDTLPEKERLRHTYRHPCWENHKIRVEEITLRSECSRCDPEGNAGTKQGSLEA